MDSFNLLLQILKKKMSYTELMVIVDLVSLCQMVHHLNVTQKVIFPAVLKMVTVEQSQDIVNVKNVLIIDKVNIHIIIVHLA